MLADHVTCQMLVELATDWMDGALAPETQVELELHMVTCTACVAYVDQLRKTRAAVGRLADDDAPPAPEVRQNLLALFRQRAAEPAEASDDPEAGEGSAGQ